MTAARENAKVFNLGSMFGLTSDVKRTVAARFGDVVDFYDMGFVAGVGKEAENNAAIDRMIAFMAANPGKTYRARKGDVFVFSDAGKVFPDGPSKLRMEGAKFRYTGATQTGAGHLLTFGVGMDFDAIRLEVAAGVGFRRAIQLSGGHDGDLVELIAETQVANSGVSNLDFGIRSLGPASIIRRFNCENVDNMILAYGGGAEDPAKVGERIGFIRARNFKAAFQPRNMKDFRLEGGSITGRSPNATKDPGNNGINTAGLVDAYFGPVLIDGSAEHNFRIGGSQGIETATKNVTVMAPILKGSGQCGFKAWTGAGQLPIVGLTVIGAQISDCGSDGFNDFGMMLQKIEKGMIQGNKVFADANVFSSYDNFYLSHLTDMTFEGNQGHKAKRNALRISEVNDNGSAAPGARGALSNVQVRGFTGTSSAAEGVYIETEQFTASGLDIDATITGGTVGVTWPNVATGAAGKNRIEANISGNSSAKISINNSTFVEVVDKSTKTRVQEVDTAVQPADTGAGPFAYKVMSRAIAYVMNGYLTGYGFARQGSERLGAGIVGKMTSGTTHYLGLSFLVKGSGGSTTDTLTEGMVLDHQGSLRALKYLSTGKYTVAEILAFTGMSAGDETFATNGRAFNGAGVQEASGAGTGVKVQYNGTAWKIIGTNVTVSA